jgi:hypothetical protein
MSAAQNTKKVTITLTDEQQRKARELSKQIFGRENISGWVAVMIEQEFNKLPPKK